MTGNDLILLDEVLSQKRSEVAPESSPSEFFELFATEQILKDYDLSYDEIESGLIGDSGDGGIDSIYIFVNGELLHEDAELADLKAKQVVVDLVVIQAKTGAGFQETPIERFRSVAGDMLDLSKDVEQLKTIYNAKLLSSIVLFRKVYKLFATKFPKLNVSFYYASRGDKPSQGVAHKVGQLKNAVAQHFPEAACELTFLGASALLQLARREPQATHQLDLAENPISSEGEIGFVCLVRLRDYYKFITNEDKTLRRQIFEANVRDYQGATEVNAQIQDALRSKNPEDFWWLNNGITILASKASQGGKTLTIEDPQIVNGLQTSTEVHKYFSEANTEGEGRKVLVRIIVPKEAEIRDRVIKANNSQTNVQQASLRATDKIHRDIEEYFRPRALYYDRRKNFYKNEGKPRDRIVSIGQLAQAVMAAVLGRPDTARARPSSLLKKNDDYLKVFNPAYPLALFHVCAEALRRIDSRLKVTGGLAGSGTEAKDRNNVRFYVLRRVLEKATGKDEPTSNDIANIDVDAIHPELIDGATDSVWSAYVECGGDDQAAKGADVLAYLKNPSSIPGPLDL